MNFHCLAVENLKVKFESFVCLFTSVCVFLLRGMQNGEKIEAFVIHFQMG